MGRSSGTPPSSGEPGGGDLLAWHGHDRRGIVYTALAGSTGTLLVVVSVGLGIYLSAPGERMRRLRRHAGWRATRVWLAVVNLLVTLAISLIALATDTSATRPAAVVGHRS